MRTPKSFVENLNKKKRRSTTVLSEEDKFSAANNFGFDLEETSSKAINNTICITNNTSNTASSSAVNKQNKLSKPSLKRKRPSMVSKAPTNKKNRNDLKQTEGKESAEKNTIDVPKIKVLPALALKSRKPSNPIVSFKEWKKDSLLMKSNDKSPSLIKDAGQKSVNAGQAESKVKRMLTLDDDSSLMDRISSVPSPDTCIRKTVLQHKTLDYHTQYTCNGCQMPFETEIRAKLHCANDCKKLLALKPVTAYTINTIFLCKLCGEKFTYKKLALGHMNEGCQSSKPMDQSEHMENSQKEQRESMCIDSGAVVSICYQSDDKKEVFKDEIGSNEIVQNEEVTEGSGKHLLVPELQSMEGYIGMEVVEGEHNIKLEQQIHIPSSDRTEIYVEILNINSVEKRNSNHDMEHINAVTAEEKVGNECNLTEASDQMESIDKNVEKESVANESVKNDIVDNVSVENEMVENENVESTCKALTEKKGEIKCEEKKTATAVDCKSQEKN